MRIRYVLSTVVILSLCAIACNSGTPKQEPRPDNDEKPVDFTESQEPQVATITRDIEFMAFLHRFTSDPDFQMAHIKFPLGKMSYAYRDDIDDYDEFTSKYWVLQSMDDLRGYFTWKNDKKIVYLYDNIIAGCDAEFETTYTFEKINGDWYVTKGNYSGSDVGLAEYTAGAASSANTRFRKKYSTPAPVYEYMGTPGDYPQASERLLTENDLAGMTKADLRVMRNEIMARHGYSFKSKDLKDCFESQSWYFPLFNNVGNYLSDIENENVKFIQAHE